MMKHLLFFCLFVGSLTNGYSLPSPNALVIPESSLEAEKQSDNSEDEAFTEGVTRHCIIRHIPMGNAPGICSIIEEIESDLSLEEERILRRMFNIHDADNRLVRQDIFSSSHDLLYTWQYAYGADGQLTGAICQHKQHKTQRCTAGRHQTKGQFRRLAFEYPYHESSNDGSARLLDYYEPTVNGNDIADVEDMWTQCEAEKYDRVTELYETYWRKCSAISDQSTEYKNLRLSFLRNAQRQWLEPAQTTWKTLISNLEDVFYAYNLTDRFKARGYDLPELGEVLWEWDYRQNFRIIRRVIALAEEEWLGQDNIIQARALVKEAEENIEPLLQTFEQALAKLHGQVRSLNPVCYNTLSQLRANFYEIREAIWQEQLSKFWDSVVRKYPQQSVACKGKAMMLFDKGDYGTAAFLFSDAIKRAYRELPPTPMISQLHDQRGSCHYENCAYEQALDDFNTAISFDPHLPSAYLGRACTFFDTQEFEKSIRDYRAYAALEQIKTAPAKPYSEDMLDFASGLQKGAVDGITKALNDFVPSLITTMSGMGQYLWASISADPEYTYKIALKTCELFDHLFQLDMASLKSMLISPLYDLAEHWQEIPYSERGTVVGQVIGHFGVDILLPGTAIKSVQVYKKFQDLRVANRIATLRVIASENPEAKLLLTKSLYSQKYYAEALSTSYPGTIIAGAGHYRNIDDLPRLMALYGGTKKDWVKKVSGTYNQIDLFGNPLPEVYFNHHRPGWYKPVVSGHWYENITTGKRYEPKIEIYQWVRD